MTKTQVTIDTEGEEPKGPHDIKIIIGDGNIIGNGSTSSVQTSQAPPAALQPGELETPPSRGWRRIPLWLPFVALVAIILVVWAIGKLSALTSTPTPPCRPTIAMTAPTTGQPLTAIRGATGIAYRFEAEGTYEGCDDPAAWSLLSVTQVDSPKCVAVHAVSLDTFEDAQWHTQIPILDTSSAGPQTFNPPLPFSLTLYLVPGQAVSGLAASTRCYPSLASAGLSASTLEAAPAATYSLQLTALKDQEK